MAHPRRSVQVSDVIAITPTNGESEGFEFLFKRLELNDVFGGTGDLQAIAVNNCHQVIQAVVGGQSSPPPSWNPQPVRRRQAG